MQAIRYSGYPDLTPPRHLTYMPAAARPLLERAAATTGYNIQVFDAPDAPLADAEHPTIAVWTYDQRKELSPFWHEYERLQQEAIDKELIFLVDMVHE